MQNRELKFKNGKFRIMQIADVQDVYPVSKDTLRLLAAASDAASPDLAVFTGDQVKGYSPALKGKNGAANAAKAIRALASPLEERGMPFAVTFGNHDGQGAADNDTQFGFYKESPMHTFADGNDAGTFALEIKGESGTAAVIYLMDSHSNAPGGGYDSVHADQIEWYRQKRDVFESENGAPVPSFVFQHIPVPEYFDVLKKTNKNAKGAVRAYGDHKNEYFILDPDNSGEKDFLGEAPAAPYINSGEVDAFLEKGEVRALFVGHDHKNSFVADYKGMKLVYTQGAGFGVYGPGLERGVRIIDIYEDGSWETFTLTFSELLGKNVEEKAKYVFNQAAPSSFGELFTALKKTAAVAASAGLVFGAVKIIGSRKNTQ